MGCAYCFASERGGNRLRKSVTGYPAEMLARRLQRLHVTENPKSAIDEFLLARQPLHFGGMSDPFTVAAIRTGETLELLRVLAKYNYPTVLSTKSQMVAEKECLSILTQGNFIVQVSFSTTCANTCSIIEPRASSPLDRMSAIQKLTGHKVPVAIRIQPVLPLHERNVEEIICMGGACDVFHVAVEFLKVGSEADKLTRQRLNSGLGLDVGQFYSQHGAKYLGREYILPEHYRIPFHKRWRSLTHDLGMTYGFADVDLLHWSDGDCCCSGVDAIPGFDGFYKYTITQATKRARVQKKNITLSLLEEYPTPKFSASHWVNSRVRKTMDNPSAPLAEYTQQKWLSGRRYLTPAMFYGIERDSANPTEFLADRSLEFEP